MSTPKTEKTSIQETLGKQHRQTMDVINSIKRDTGLLIRQIENVVDEVVDEDLKAMGDAGLEDDPANAVAGRENAELIEAISKICTREVMDRINPILNALQKFIKANALDSTTQPAPKGAQLEDDDFAGRLVDEMKRAHETRLQRIALARKRLSSPGT